MQTLYRVLIVLCLLFLASGIVYMTFFLPKSSSATAVPLQVPGSQAHAGLC
ncbi:hypothetical protein [Brevibacillus fulvus]|uniref:Flagellar basal body-associated protein FliL n=1 Tax=Brevibacillus fulvus TaxID=1125967 RepID=A0A938XTD2_9BACL|nr:hypothetical protein [Brevibacillus fulvus]MBM7590108.1 flagellar basal body-associated protein FliL [Brevibacillus fulvus]